MAKHPTLLQHFRSFAYQNNIKDFDTALKYFAVFGGTGWDVDVSRSVDALIEEKVLANYADLHESMTRYTHNNGLYHMVLTIIALGVNHENDVFKKAKEVILLSGASLSSLLDKLSEKELLVYKNKKY